MIVGIILAAGKSVRMGQPKLLLPLQGKTVIRHVVENALGSRLDDVLVVLGVGKGADRIRSELGAYPVRTVENPDFADGQSTSLKAGMRLLPADVEAVLILMGDQPFVSAEVINAIIARFRAGRCPIVVPEYAGQPGAPVLFDSSLFPELRAATGDKGGRDVVSERRESVSVVKFDSALPAKDIDTWQEYQAIVALAPAGIPNPGAP